MKLLKFLVLFTAIAVQSSQGARILFYFAFSTYSHRIAVWPLVEALANRGHKIHFLSPYQTPERHPNITEIQPPELVSLMRDPSPWGNIVERRMEKNYEKIWDEIRERGVEACAAVFADEWVRELLTESEFDLVFIDSLYNECGLGLAYKYGAPFIVYAAGPIFVWQPDAHGFFPETAWIPDVSKDYPLEMTFLQKVFNTLNPIFWHFGRHWSDFPEMDKILWQALKIRKMPPLEELEKNVSLVLHNNHFCTEFPRSLPPLYVSVAGMHCQKGRKVEPLKKEIEDFIQGGSDGFIYINFGSSLKFSDLNMKQQKIFTDVLGAYENVRFIWKWEDPDRPETIPSNVLTLGWVPQQALLAHPKIRAFINHGGLLGIQEAITYAVPLIVIPIFFDQNYNAEKVARQGYGIRLDITKLRKEGLSDAISNIMNESKYTQKAAFYSRLFQDRPMKPIDTAIWWTEYVLRHGTGVHLRPHAQTHNWLQRRSLDVYAFLIAVVFFLLVTFYILLRQAIIMLLSWDDDDGYSAAERAKRRRRLAARKDEMEPLLEEDAEEGDKDDAAEPHVEGWKARHENRSGDEDSTRPNSPSEDGSRPHSPPNNPSSVPGSPSRSPEPLLDPNYVKSKDA